MVMVSQSDLLECKGGTSYQILSKPLLRICMITKVYSESGESLCGRGHDQEYVFTNEITPLAQHC